MLSISPLVHTHLEQIHRLAGIADTVGAVLGAFPLLPSRERVAMLSTCAGLADDLATALAAITREAL